jgi:hypothetical protein
VTGSLRKPPDEFPGISITLWPNNSLCSGTPERVL